MLLVFEFPLFFLSVSGPTPKLGSNVLHPCLHPDAHAVTVKGFFVFSGRSEQGSFKAVPPQV